jgi:hypothetical protein
MISRFVAMLLLLALSWTQLGSGYRLSCDTGEAFPVAGESQISTGNHFVTPSHNHSAGTLAHEELADTSDEAPLPGCPLLAHGQGCSVAAALPVAAVVELKNSESFEQALGRVPDALNLLLPYSLLRPPQA